jgi:hypothetical protein
MVPFLLKEVAVMGDGLVGIVNAFSERFESLSQK